MGGRCDPTLNEFMTPKTFLRTFKIYIEMFLLTYTNQLYPLIVLGKCQYNGTTGSLTKVIFSPCPLFIVNL